MRKRNNAGRFIKDGVFPRYKKCLICGQKFYCRSLLKYQTGRYCSKECLGKANAIMNKGKRPYKMTKKTKVAISKAKEGVQIWGGKRIMNWLVGEKNPNWKGGITSYETKQRKKFMATIQRLVFERDSYTCQMCGTKTNLQVDHIQPWAEYVKLRFSIDNCRTLCAGCHYEITYKRPMPLEVKAWGHNLLKKGGALT